MSPPTAAETQPIAFEVLLAEPDVRERLARIWREVFAERLCTRCLGRILSRAARERTPEDKGSHVAIAIGAEPVPAAACAWCEDLFTETDRFADLVEAAAAGYEYDSFLLGTRLHPDAADKENAVQEILGAALKEQFEPLRTELNRTLGAVLAPRTGKRVDFTRPDITATVDPQFDQVVIAPASVYLYGRYRKYDRRIPQTRWPCTACRGGGCKRCDGTGKLYQDSVEELVAAVALDAFEAGDEAFHGSGREDIDALMLGNGRPFVLELKEPRRRRPVLDGSPGDLAALQERINLSAGPRVAVEALRFSDKDEVVRIKEAAFDKAYRAHVVTEAAVERHALEAAIEKILEMPIEQRTPERVAHRRADKVRPRRVKSVTLTAWGHHARADHEAEAPLMAPEDAGAATATRFTLDILAEAGTYIKELVSGDDGRTQPSFAGLLQVPMRVEYLDVVGVGGADA